MKILSVVGARPNFIKIAPLIKEMKKYRQIKPILVHTGQHYDYEMSKIFFDELKIPKPDYNLGVGSGSPAYQIGEAMIKFEKVILKEKPDLVIVVGDANAALIGALSAVKFNIPVAHIEAGLRSFDRKMPEEINRILTDHLSDYLLTTEPQAMRNLIREGIPKKKIFVVGNIMIDSLKKLKVKNPACAKASEGKQKSKILEKLELKKKEYVVLTLHRPKNVDDKKTLQNLFETFKIISQKIPIIFPAHPRTIRQIKKFHLNSQFIIHNSLFRIIPSLGYLEMLNLMKNSKFVMTDSGGIQEETTVLEIPCLTLRKNTERPITVEIGTNIIVGQNKEKILKEVNKILIGKGKKGKIPKYWDGQTAKRIVKKII